MKRRIRAAIAAIGIGSVAALVGCASTAQRSGRTGRETVAIKQSRFVMPPGGSIIEVTHTVAGRPRSTFLSRWPSSRGGPVVLEEFALSGGRPLHQLARLPERISIPHAQRDGSVWLTLSSGPLLRDNTAGGDPAPNSCSGSVMRVNLQSGETKTGFSFPSSTRVDEAVPSPDGRRVVVLAGGCATSFLNQHLVVADTRSARRWAIGAAAMPCHSLYTPAWSPDGSKLVFAYGPSTVTKLPRQHNLGAGLCSQPRAGEIAVVSASHSSELSSARLIPAAHGCSYQATVFDRRGIAAIEACEEGSPRGYRGLGGYLGNAYLVQLDGNGHAVLRLALRRGSNIGRLAGDPASGLVLVSEAQGENTTPAFDWIWTFDGHRLRAVGHYNANVTAEPW